MSALQQEFALAAAKLIQQSLLMGYDGVTLGEAWRTPQQAQWNADHGTGIAHSLHIERLAIDLNFFKSGALITDGSQLADIGAWWESLGPNYRWGGRFTHLPDGNHFSLSPDGHIA
jgi:hypothetical protein